MTDGKREIIYVSTDKIKPYENNPRINDLAIDKVRKSIETFGFNVPLILDKNNIIIAGHTRLKAAQELGLEKVPCIIRDDLTENQTRAYRLADNKTAELSEWDIELLKTELEDIEGFTGFEEVEIAGMFEEIDIDNFFKESEEKPKEEVEEEIQCPHCNMYFKP